MNIYKHGEWHKIESKADLPQRSWEYIWQNADGFFERHWFSTEESLNTEDFTKFTAWLYLDMVTDYESSL